MTIFKITKKHLSEYSELEKDDLGLYGLKISDDKEIMVYETRPIAEKALQYFKKSFKAGA